MSLCCRHADGVGEGRFCMVSSVWVRQNGQGSRASSKSVQIGVDALFVENQGISSFLSPYKPTNI